MKENNHYQGSCFCGSVQFSLEGEPEAMAYCHCDSCRRWSAGPLSAFTLWKPDNIRLTHGSDQLTSYNGNPGSEHQDVVSIRTWCKNCGGHVFTEHPQMGVTDVPAVVISDLEFKPAFHVHYQETAHLVRDGLPKFKDLPLQAGGSGSLLSDDFEPVQE